MAAPAPMRNRYPRALGPAREGPTRPSLRLGRVHGVPIGLNWTWLLILGLIVWSLADAQFPAANPGLGRGVYLAMAAVGAVLFFVSLLLHELGHAVVAQREGMEIEGITLWVFGGVARFKGMFPSAGAELRIALAGPAVSVALGVAFTLAARLLSLPGAVDGVATWLGAINLLLVGFNLIPALPLDGGRALRAALWARRGDFARATRTAGTIAQGVGRALIWLGILLFLVSGALGGLWLALIGWFVLSAARAETAYGAMSEALAGLRVADAMIADPDCVEADMSLMAFLEGVFAPSGYAAYPVVRDERVVGVIAAGDVAVLAPSELAVQTVADRMLPIERALVLDAELDLTDATTRLLGTPLGRALVRRDGEIIGLLSVSDAQRLVESHAQAAA